MLVVGLGQDLGRREVEQRAAEQAEVAAEQRLRDGEEQRGRRAGDRCRRVREQHRQRACGGRSRRARVSVYVLKPSAKSWAITATATAAPMPPPTWKAAPIATPSMALWPTIAAAAVRPTSGVRPSLSPAPCAACRCGQQAFHQMGEQKTADEEQQGRRHAEDLGAGRFQGLREEFQADHAQHQPAGQAQHQVAAVGHAVCRPAAGQRHQERAERDEDRHVLFVSDRRPVAHA